MSGCVVRCRRSVEHPPPSPPPPPTYERLTAFSFALAFIPEAAASIALKLPTASRTTLSNQCFHRFVVALPTRMMTKSDPWGIVADTSAVRVGAALENFEKNISLKLFFCELNVVGMMCWTNKKIMATLQ